MTENPFSGAAAGSIEVAVALIDETGVRGVESAKFQAKLDTVLATALTYGLLAIAWELHEVRHE